MWDANTNKDFQVNWMHEVLLLLVAKGGTFRAMGSSILSQKEEKQKEGK
jgi:hypothetical protein